MVVIATIALAGLSSPAQAATRPAGTRAVSLTKLGGGSPVGAVTNFTYSVVPGAATDIGIGANGAVWVVGTDPVDGGYGIFHWTGSAWEQVPGGAVRIAVDPQGDPWVVNSAHDIFRWNGSSWAGYPGSATDISVGANGAVWVVGTDPVGGGYGIFHWAGSAWVNVPGGAVTVAVDPQGDPWVINSSLHIFHLGGSGWTLEPDLATDIAAGANGSVWIVGTNTLPGGYGLLEWNGASWVPQAGGAVRIAVDPDGNPWIINSSHQILVAVPESPPTITSVSFTGSSAAPTITVNGSGFGSVPPSASPGCDASGTEYVNDDLTVVDNTGNWLAGVPGACVSLANVSWTNTQIQFNLAGEYGSTSGGVDWVLNPGDNVTVQVVGASDTLTISS